MLPKSYLIPSQNIALPAEYSTLELFQVHQLWMRKIMLRRERAPYWRLYYPYQETCILTHEGVETLLSAGRAVLIPPDTDLAGRIIAPLRMFYIHFRIGGKLAECRNAVFQLQEDTALTQLIENATEHLKKKLPIDFHLCMNIAAIVSAALAKIPDVWISSNKRLESVDLLNVWNVMQKHPERNYTNKELAAKANMSVNTFLRRFQWNFGQSPQHFLIQQRIEKAKTMLKDSMASHEDIAKACGFANQQYFSRIFRKYTDWTPGAYRNAHGALRQP
ncbi:MAG: AraC family transcriptional regulator [Lentisphaeria bacterium]|nr:AraC family transcriptional regulator [Lentisphaeria bacterium]